ncbi:MAG: VOC family protein [Xanthomonadales bacterium]|nr:VOC family protein [Xanthomonadales bacterium]
MSHTVRGIHHINFLVRDLDAAIQRYEALLGVPVTVREPLPRRGVDTARFRLGDTWLVLIQPTGAGIPADHLEQHGEGFFLMSLAVDDLEQSSQSLAGSPLQPGPIRHGVANWRIADLDRNQTFDAQLQLAEEDSQ